MERRGRRLNGGAASSQRYPRFSPVATRAVVARMRAFNRFYTRRLGILRPDFLDSGLSLSEARVLYELANRKRATASQLVAALGLDPGYVSRVLKGFEKRGIVERRRYERDRRTRLVRLTASGRQRFAALDTRQTREVESIVDALDSDRRRLLLWSISAIEEMLANGASAPAKGQAQDRPQMAREHA
jgi:DNA-binding MarR family transcriptional regulator